MCPRFLFVGTIKSVHKSHHPQSHTWSTHGRNRTLTLIPQTNNKQSNAHSHVVRIHHSRGRCNQQNVSERNLENIKHNSRRVATLLPRDGLTKSQNVPHIWRIGNPVSIHFHESKLTRRDPTCI